MQKVHLEAEIGLSHSDHDSENVLDFIALRRGKLAMDQAERIARQEAEDKAELLSSKASGDSHSI